MNSITQTTKYELIENLKTLLIETIGLKQHDISLQATKVLKEIHSSDILSREYSNKIKKYFELKNDANYTASEMYLYNKISFLYAKIENDCNPDLLFCNLDFEYKSSINRLLLKLQEKIDHDKTDQFLNYCIYGGVIQYYNSIIYTLINTYAIKDIEENHNENRINFLNNKIKPLYDFYYLEMKEKELIGPSYEYLSEWLLLKIAIISVLNKLIHFLNSLKNTKIVDNETKQHLDITINFDKFPELKCITTEQRIVLNCLINNYDIDDIAQRLCKSKKTIQNQISAISTTLKQTELITKGGKNSLKHFFRNYPNYLSNNKLG